MSTTSIHNCPQPFGAEIVCDAVKCKACNGRGHKQGIITASLPVELWPVDQFCSFCKGTGREKTKETGTLVTN